MIQNFISNITSWVTSNNPFANVNFSVLYSWLPSDIAGACSLAITVAVVLFCIGILKKVLSW